MPHSLSHNNTFHVRAIYFHIESFSCAVAHSFLCYCGDIYLFICFFLPFFSSHHFHFQKRNTHFKQYIYEIVFSISFFIVFAHTRRKNKTHTRNDFFHYDYYLMSQASGFCRGFQVILFGRHN